MSSLLDVLAGGLDQRALERLGSQIGAPPQQTERAVAAALPLLVGALQRNAASPQGADALAGALERDHDGSVVDDVPGFFSRPPTASDERSVDHIFGPRRAPVENAVSRASGLGSAQVMQLLAQLAPLLLAALSRARASSGSGAGTGASNANRSGAGGLGDVLGGALGRMQSSNPGLGGLLGSLLDSNGDGSIVDDLLGKALGGGAARGSAGGSGGGGLGGLLGELLGGRR
jgi:hypothetical protein